MNKAFLFGGAALVALLPAVIGLTSNVILQALEQRFMRYKAPATA